jgi:hypothetical protein
VRLCHEWGATNIRMALMHAVFYGQEKITQLCRDEWGVEP